MSRYWWVWMVLAWLALGVALWGLATLMVGETRECATWHTAVMENGGNTYEQVVCDTYVED